MMNIFSPRSVIDRLHRLCKPNTHLYEHSTPFRIENEWCLYDIEGNGETRLIYGPEHNAFVRTGEVLVSILLSRNDASAPYLSYYGLQQFALGHGNPSWDSLSAPPPVDITRTTLVSELADGVGRISLGLSFIDVTGATTASPTNVLRATAIFPAHYGNGDRREWGIFGGNATGTRGSGMLFDASHFVKTTKTAASAEQWQVKWTITLV